MNKLDGYAHGAQCNKLNVRTCC